MCPKMLCVVFVLLLTVSVDFSSAFNVPNKNESTNLPPSHGVHNANRSSNLVPSNSTSDTPTCSCYYIEISGGVLVLVTVMQIINFCIYYTIMNRRIRAALAKKQNDNYSEADLNSGASEDDTEYWSLPLEPKPPLPPIETIPKNKKILRRPRIASNLFSNEYACPNLNLRPPEPIPSPAPQKKKPPATLPKESTSNEAVRPPQLAVKPTPRPPPPLNVIAESSETLSINTELQRILQGRNMAYNSSTSSIVSDQHSMRERTTSRPPKPPAKLPYRYGGTYNGNDEFTYSERM